MGFHKSSHFLQSKKGAHLFHPLRRVLLVMIKFFVYLIVLIISLPVFGCNEISGVYKSVSETHWNYQLEINNSYAKLIYTNYWRGKNDAKTKLKQISEGSCSKNDNEYLLTFVERSIKIQYHKLLSHKPYGGEGESPGITGEFNEGKTNNLWQVQNDM